MWFWYLAAVVVICLVVVGLVLFWSIFISKPEEVEEDSVVLSPRIDKSELHASLLEHLTKYRDDGAIGAITDDTVMTKVDVIVCILIIKEKYNLILVTVGNGVFKLQFKNGGVVEFDVNKQSINTVREFVEVFDKGFNFPPK